MKHSVIIIGKADIIKLSLIRSLGDAGCRIVVIQLMNVRPRLKPLDYYSRYVDAYHFAKPDDVVKCLIEKCTEQGQRPIVFALDDQSVSLIDSAYDRLSPHFILPHVDQRQGGIVAMMNKMEQKRLAQQAGLLVPKGWEIPFVNGEYLIPSDIEFPCFVKGLYSYINTKGIQSKCNDEQELKSCLERCKAEAKCSILAEEYISIDKELCFMAMNHNGKHLVPAMLDKKEDGRGCVRGVTMAAELIPFDENSPYYQPIQRLLASFNYTGINDAGFILSCDQLYFVEVNFRYAAYGYAIARAGVNLPAIFVNCLFNENHDDFPKTLQTRKSFINEKIGLMNVVQGYMTYSQYRTIKLKTDFGIVASKNDPKPYRHFLTRFIFKYIKSKMLKR